MPDPKAEKKKKPKKATGPKFKRAPDELVDLFSNVRNKHHAVLKAAKITIVLVTDEMKAQGTVVPMKVGPAPALLRCPDFGGMHGLIYVSEKFWRETMANAQNRDQRRQAEKLVKIEFDQQLCQVSYSEGSLKVIRPVAMSLAVIKHWGLDAPGIATNPLVVAIREQLQLEFEPGAEADQEEDDRLPEAAH